MKVDRSTLTLSYLVLAIALVVALFPLALMLLNSLKAAAAIVQNPLSLPVAPQFVNFANAWRDLRFPQTALNSLVVTLCTALLVVGTTSMSAYVIARQKFRGWSVVSFYFLACTTIPMYLIIIPLYFMFAKLGWLNNLFTTSLIYVAVNTPFSLFLLRTYYLAVPVEIEESASIDGANAWQIFTKVLLPIVSPGLLTVGLIVSLNTWNEFLVASTFLQNQRNMTLVVSFNNLSGQYTSDWGEIMAAAMLLVLPIVALFLAAQRRFIEGMAGGSVKG